MYLSLSWRRVKKGGKKMPKPIKTVLALHDRAQIITRTFRAAGNVAYSVSAATCSGGFPAWHIERQPAAFLAHLCMVDRHDVTFVRADDGSVHALIPANIDLVVILVSDGVPGTMLWRKAKALGAAVAMLMPPAAEYRSINAPVQHIRSRALYLHGVPALHFGGGDNLLGVAAEMARQWG